MEPDDTLDARGLLCPLPVLKLRKRLKADDPAAVVDVPHFCAEAGEEFVDLAEADGYSIFRVRKRRDGT
jgi:tRNA 2-thiouridine synthesizing protein A